MALYKYAKGANIAIALAVLARRGIVEKRGLYLFKY